MSKALEIAVRDRRRVGYCQIDNEIIDEYGLKIGAYGVAVYNVLCRHARNDKTQQVRLSTRDIAETLAISHDRVRKSLADLVNSGLVRQDAPPERHGPGAISTFTLLNVKKSWSNSRKSWTPHVQVIRKTKPKLNPRKPQARLSREFFARPSTLRSSPTGIRKEPQKDFRHGLHGASSRRASRFNGKCRCRCSSMAAGASAELISWHEGASGSSPSSAIDTAPEASQKRGCELSAPLLTAGSSCARQRAAFETKTRSKA